MDGRLPLLLSTHRRAFFRGLLSTGPDQDHDIVPAHERGHDHGVDHVHGHVTVNADDSSARDARTLDVQARARARAPPRPPALHHYFFGGFAPAGGGFKPYFSIL